MKKKINEFLKKINKGYKDLFKNYKFTNILIIICTLLSSMYDVFDNESYIYPFIFTMFITIFLSELFFKDKKRIIGYCISIIYSVIFTYVVNNSVNDNIYLIYLGLFTLIGVAIIYLIIKKYSNKNIGEFLAKTFDVSLITGIITSSLFSVIITLFLITNYLLFDGTFDDELILRIYIIILGLYTLPNYLIGLFDTNKKINNITNLLIKNIFIPILDITVIVILLYIIKIIFSFELPKNEVFRIITALFVVMYPLILVSNNYKGKLYEFNSKYLHYVFILPLLLQIYSLYLRINDYGLTTSRYIGIMIILFEITSILLFSIRNKKYLKYNFISFSIIIIICTILPYFNVKDYPIYNQLNRIKSIVKTDTNILDLSKSDKSKIVTAYYYLKENKKLNLLPDYIDKDVIEKLPKNNDNPDINRYKYYYYNDDNIIMDISKYNKLEEIYSNTMSSNKEVLIGNEKIDISRYLNNLSDDFSKYVSNNKVIKIDSSKDFYIKHINIDYDAMNEKISYIDISGYILFK